MHEVPNSPWAAKTIRSAVTPAPEDGSKPAIVRTVLTVFRRPKVPLLSKFQKNCKFPAQARFRVNMPFSGHELQLFGCIEAARVSIFYTTRSSMMQAKCSTNLFTLFDFGLLRLDNSRWSVRMKTYPFRTAQSRSKLSVPKLSAGVLLMGLALSASARDAGEPNQQQPAAIQGKTPQLGDKTTHKSRRWYQVGVASWYGTHFQGRKTADGERFDMNRMTCAHPTLPMGTWLRVTNLRNRQSTFVRVNDRGPVVEGRIIDLSAAAARVLGLSGIGKVRLEAIRDTDPELAMALVSQLRTPTLLSSENQ
jgi:rare lipoprotein A